MRPSAGALNAERPPSQNKQSVKVIWTQQKCFCLGFTSYAPCVVFKDFQCFPHCIRPPRALHALINVFLSDNPYRFYHLFDISLSIYIWIERERNIYSKTYQVWTQQIILKCQEEINPPMDFLWNWPSLFWVIRLNHTSIKHTMFKWKPIFCYQMFFLF